mmetsp:Transcript_25745/g.48699  ORF Transcript_25745/g.48699 Transcript_25745/m.48699 type:complete len:373 (+) Transcript_25745:284-1402(+)
MPGAAIGESGFSRVKGVDEAHRLSIIRDAKSRTIGVDRGALSAQVAERSMRLSQQRKEDLQYDQDAMNIDQQLQNKEQERLLIQAQMRRENADYWSTHQAPHLRSEYDLNRPHLLRSELPVRVGDVDARLSLSSAQVFEGEDHMAGERKKMQMLQSRAWFAQQVAEKQARAEEEKEEDKNYMALAIAQAQHSLQVDGAGEAVRRRAAFKNAQENRALAIVQNEEKQHAIDEEVRANEMDKYNTYNSAILTEHPALSLNTTGRVRKDYFKGMMPNEKQAIMDFQAAQRDELQAKRIAERKAESEFARQSLDITRAASQRHAQIEMLRAEQRKSMQANLLTQQELKKIKELESKRASMNTITPEFFAQFGKTIR